MNNFHIYEEVGRGKYSVVYKGRKKKSIDYVAVKSIEKNRRKKVLNEVRIFHSLKNRHILKFYNWYETRNHLWIIFEYCAGGDLYQLIEQDKKLPEETIQKFGRDLAQGLYYLHANNIIYADLKPSNVLANEYNTLKLCDFGLSKKLNDLNKVSADGDESKPKSGTPYYMAPELFSDDGVYSFYSDMWALGCVLYELATGKPPFAATGLKDLITQICEEDTPQVEEMSPLFNDLLARLLEKDPVKRIYWEHLRKHPFWAKEINQRKIPRQPQFDKYLKECRGIDPEEFHEQQMRGAFFIPNVKYKAPKRVDPLRVSQSISKNMMKDINKDAYTNDTQQPSDLNLENRDQEIQFGQEPDMNDVKIDSGQKPGPKMGGMIEQKDDPNIDKNEIVDIKEGKGSNILGDKQNQKSQNDKRGKETPQDHIKKDTTNAQPMGLDPNAQNQTQSKVPLKTIDQLLIHNSDTAVKPIIGNKEIEKTGELVFNPQTLPFEVWSSEQVASKIETVEIEGHLHEVYNAMAASGTVNDKLNTLVYFESIILNSNVANRLINSAFMNLLTKLLKNVKSPHLKLRLCSILGQLVRHSTVIGNEVAESGLAQLLSEVISDKNEKVRRKAVASLGEFMFYAATQLDDEQADPVWNLNPIAIKSLIKCLHQGEDDVVRFYACKTIENITAQSISAGCNFATLEVATLLLNIYHTQTTDSFRTSAAVSVSHICKLNTTLFPTIFESITCKQFSLALLEGTQRIQQAFLTMINIALTQPYPKLNDTLQEDETFQNAIAALLENQSIVLRGKAVLTFLLLFKMNPQWMIIAVEQDFYKNIDKLLRDNYKYVQCCLLCLIETVSQQQIPTILAMTKDSFAQFLEGNLKLDSYKSLGIKRVQNRNNRQFYNIKGGLLMIHTIQEMVASSSFKSKICKKSLIEMLSYLFEHCEEMQNNDTIIEFRSVLFNVLESMAKNSKLLISNSKEIMECLLPVIVKKVESQSADVRFQSLKAFTDFITQFLCDDKIYNSEENSESTQYINELILKKLFPHYGLILSDADPMPLFGLKLLSVVVERNAAFVVILNKLKLIDILFQYFEVNHLKFNAFTVKIIRAIVLSREIELTELMQMNVVVKMNGILENVMQNNQEWCTDHLLEIIIEILHLASELKEQQGEKNGASESKQIDEYQEQQLPQIIFDSFLINFEYFIVLLGSSDITIIEKASQNILAFIHFSMIQGIVRNDLLVIREDQLKYILPAFKTDKTTICKNLIKSLYWALSLKKNALRPQNPDNSNKILKIAEKLQASDDKSLTNTAREVVKLCKNLIGQ